MPVDMKTIISNTLMSMMKEKGIDKITVKSLIDACNISRQTFYYHFQDIMEVIEWSMEQATQSTLARSLEADTPEEALSVLISSAVENRRLIRKLLDSQKREQIERLFVHSTKTYLQELIKNSGHPLSISYSDMELALNFWAFGISGLLFLCCEQNQVDVKSLAKQICRLLPETIETDKK